MPATTKAQPKQHFAIGYYNRYVQGTFENPVTEEMDIIETAMPDQAEKYDDIEKLKAVLAKLGLNRKFYNASGQLLLTVQAVSAPR